MNEIPDLDSKIRIATQIDFFEKRYWEMIKELHAKNDMLEEQAKEIKQLEVDVEHYADRWRIAIDRANSLYTHPMRELSDEEIWKLWQTHLNDEITVFAKALIKEASEK